MASINYIKGDATYPIGDGNKIIVHVCNNLGLWGKGFVLALSKRWPEPEKRYRVTHEMSGRQCLGSIQVIDVEEDNIFVINMICQQGIMSKGREDPPIRYPEMKECLKKVKIGAQMYSASVHMPRIGCGLAGGEWSRVESIITKTLVDKEVEVFVYDQ